MQIYSEHVFSSACNTFTIAHLGKVPCNVTKPHPTRYWDLFPPPPKKEGFRKSCLPKMAVFEGCISFWQIERVHVQTCRPLLNGTYICPSILLQKGHFAYARNDCLVLDEPNHAPLNRDRRGTEVTSNLPFCGIS